MLGSTPLMVATKYARKQALEVLIRDKVRKCLFSTVLRIRIHRIHMFLGLPDPDPLVRGMDPAPAPEPDPSIIMQKSKKTLDSYYLAEKIVLKS